MNKITPEHLTRDAYVYVRQSTADQLLNNPESRRRQYALVARARSLGWEHVIVIDDDLGRSGGGQLRPGFERLLAAICAGKAGAVLAIEASRLARNGRDWHTLLEFCALVNSLIIDEDGIYDPRLVNDRLLLGLKGTFSELELSIFRQRSQEALRLKAARGELYTTVAIGYRRSADDRLEQDPDRRIREALSLVFRKFSEIGSVRQLALWLRQEGIDLPIAVYGRQGRTVQWRPPRYNTVHRLLTNPVYAGAYVFGRTGSRARLDGGRKVITHGVARPREEWGVLIRDRHDGYISWEEYDRNQKIIAGNANEGHDGGRLGAQGRRASRWTAPLRALRTQAQGTAPCAARYSLYLQCRNGLRQRQEVHHVQQYARRCGGVGGSAAGDLTPGH